MSKTNAIRCSSTPNYASENSLWHFAKSFTSRLRKPDLIQFTHSLHGAELFCRSQPVLSQSRNSPHFTEPEGSFSHSQVPSTCPYCGLFLSLLHHFLRVSNSWVHHHGLTYPFAFVRLSLWYIDNSEVCNPRCVFNLYSEVNSVKNTTINIWLNDGV